CIAPDLIGMGRSEKPELAYRFADHARYLDAFIGALGLEQFTIVAHDWGSALAFDWMAQHPGAVRRLAFFEAFLAPTPSFEVFAAGNRELFPPFPTPRAADPLLLQPNPFIPQLPP